MSYVAIIKGICPVCCADHTHGSSILLHKQLKDIPEDKVPTEWALCEPCEKHRDNGLTALVEIDLEKSDFGTEPNGYVKLEGVYRTGTIAWFPNEALNIDTSEGMCLVPEGTIAQLQEQFKQRAH